MVKAARGAMTVCEQHQQGGVQVGRVTMLAYSPVDDASVSRQARAGRRLGSLGDAIWPTGHRQPAAHGRL